MKNVSVPLPQACGTEGNSGVGKSRLSYSEDAALETHIKACGERMEASWAMWELHGNFADHGEASYWLGKMQDAIRSRSPEQVARLEQERGLQ